MAVKPKPEGYHTLTPYLVIDGAQTLIDFLEKALGAQLMFSMPGEGGKIGHAEMKIGDSVVMLADATESETGREMPATIMVYVDDCDKTYATALESGATSVRAPADQFYGDRSAGVRDPVGNHWWIHTHIEDVSPEEMERRVAEASGSG